MKYYTLITCLFLFNVHTINAQTNFKWDITDSVKKNKDKLYSDTKSFIANKWKSAKDVIQNDDKEDGNIIIKGVSIQKINHSMNEFTYIYNYSVTFKFKENRFKIIIDNVFCESAYPVGQAKYDIQKIDPFEGDYVKAKTGISTATLPEKKAVLMMQSLKSDLQSIIDDYLKYIKAENSANDNW